MNKFYSLILALGLFSGTVFGGTVRIEDSATATTGLCSYDGTLKAYSTASNGNAINLSNSAAKGITWKVEVSAAGTYQLTWRYVNGGASAATTAKLIINSTTVSAALSFPKTVDKATFITNTASVTFVKGVNQIRIETLSSAEFADIDWIEITGSTIGAADCSAAIGSGGGGTTTVPVTGVTVSPTSSAITTAGGTVQLIPTIAPSNASNTAVTWTSSSTSVATVSSTGLVTAVANGSATITVKTTDGAKTATTAITVNITPATVPVTGVTVSPTSSMITSANGTVQLTATIAPSNATNKAVTWTTSASGVATVSSTGLVTGIANGSATITVRTTDGAKTATCAITVNISSTPPPATDMVGYATVSGEGYSTTTGGAGGASRTITTLADLQTWATSRENNTTPEVIYIGAKISASASTVITIKHGSNISIYGVGTVGELQNVGLNIVDYKNVIIRNMKIHEVFYPDDALTIDASFHVWVDHCELYSKIGAGITVDTYDGLLDIKKGSRYVTISWCYLHHHMKCSLIGHTDNTGQQAEDSQIRVTYHHNWFSYTDGRNPSLRFGAVHMFNNYFEEISDYGLAARDGGHAKLENNHYNNVLLPMSTDKFPVDGLPNGYICESGTLLSGTTGAKVISQTGCDFWTSSSLPYSYSVDAVANVAAIVKANTGVGKVTNLKSGEGITSVAIQKDTKVNVYPNPFSSAAIVSFNLNENAFVKITLTDLSGRQVSEIANKAFVAGWNEFNYSNPALKSGLYILTLETGGTTNKVKLVVK